MTGLKYVHAVKKMGIRVENETYMVGSYGPKLEVYEFMTPFDDMPSGMVTRGWKFITVSGMHVAVASSFLASGMTVASVTSKWTRRLS